MPAVNLAFAGYRAGSFLARALPEPALTPVARTLAMAAAHRLAERRLIVERNLARAGAQTGSVEQRRREVNKTFESYTRYWLESFRLPGTAPAEIARGMSTQGFEQVPAGLDAGRGVILALPHLGGWEWAAFWLTEVLHMPVSAVVEPVEPPELAEWFVALREALGMEIIPLGPSAGSAVMRALKANRFVCLLSDRDIGGGGIEVEFFGERTTLPGGPATLALRTGAPLLPAAVYYRDGGHHAVVRPALPVERTGRLRDDVARITQQLADELETLIRAEPAQWHLMQPNWPSDHRALQELRSRA